MVEDRFDDLTLGLAAGISRRTVIAGAAALLGAIGVRTGTQAQVSQVQCGNVACAANPSICTGGCVCCVYTNPITGQVFNSRCRPPGSCRSGQEGPSTTTTTTSTTTTAPTTTTTTTVTTSPPSQGTCEAGENVCESGLSARCNGRDDCFCFTTTTGKTFCGGFGDCVSCDSNDDCIGETGPGSACIIGGGPVFCCPGRVCQAPCAA